MLTYGNSILAKEVTSHPVFMNVTISNCEVFVCQYATVAGVNHNYFIYIIGMGY